MQYGTADEGGSGGCAEKALKQKKLHKIWVKDRIVNQKLNFWLTIWNFCPFYLYFPNRKHTKQRLFCDEKGENLQWEKNKKSRADPFRFSGGKFCRNLSMKNVGTRRRKTLGPAMKKFDIRRWKILRSFGDDLGICWRKLWERLRTTLDGSGSTLDKPRTTTDRSGATTDRLGTT